MPSSADRADLDQAVALAGRLLTDARRLATRQQRRRAATAERLLRDPAAKTFVADLTDRVLRAEAPSVAADELHELVRRSGTPPSFRAVDRLLLWTGAMLAPRLPAVVMPLVTGRLRAETAGVIVAAEDGPLSTHLARRRAEHVRSNLNVLGEAILGEDEAAHRLREIETALARPDVDYVSVKVSAVAANIGLLAFDEEVVRIADRLLPLYQQARASGGFVNLDMEEHRDLHLTIAVFQRLLDRDDLLDLEAGIVLQAYLPDSHAALDELTTWSLARRSRGGAAIKVRIVKGANLAMEQVDAELHGWPQTPYPTKADVDASYKRILDVALTPQRCAAVRVGVASHNLFDVAWALGLRARRGVADRVELEMLEGMADSQALRVRDEAGGVLLYTPVAKRADVRSAIAYLTRRLDENTSPEGFLAHLFTMAPGNEAFDEQRRRFEEAVGERHRVATAPRRSQDRGREHRSFSLDDAFENEPDTDLSLAPNRAWALSLVATPPDLTVPQALTSVADVDRAVAVAAASTWGERSPRERALVLERVAEVMAAGRGEAVAVMAAEAGKVVAEGDPEVSEGVDFARWYARSALDLDAVDGARHRPLGVVVVAPPWNFPYAIAAGGVLAALAAGNAVILKPAPQVPATAWLIARQLWAAGVPKDALTYLRVPEDEIGRRLLTHPDVGGVVLTGAAETAALFLDWKPDLRLSAETSGKNAIVVTARADLDLAVKDLVRSAFGHAGQKCSAASLAIVEAGVLDGGTFLRQVADAVRSLPVGWPHEPRAVVGPLIEAPAGKLLRALTQLDDGESWLVEPQCLSADRRLWSPGVRVGVRPGSWAHLTEWFGPVLAVLRADDLDHAIVLQNMPAYGLTGGLHSLDGREQGRWLDRVEVGNASINRGITGAIVRRQPFGGWKRSSVGPGAKAGGPHMVQSLGTWQAIGRPAEQAPPPPEVARLVHALGGGDALRDAAGSDAHWWRERFSTWTDPTAMVAERNILRYRPLAGPVLLRGDDRDLVARTLVAAATAGATVSVSAPAPLAGVDAVVEDEAALAARLGAVHPAKLRIVGRAGDDLRRAALAAGVPVDDVPVVGTGQIELLRWVREQAVSITAHRHGNPIPVTVLDSRMQAEAQPAERSSAQPGRMASRSTDAAGRGSASR